MGENLDCSETDTIPIPLLDVERKTLPVFCPWCDIISGVAKLTLCASIKSHPRTRPAANAWISLMMVYKNRWRYENKMNVCKDKRNCLKLSAGKAVEIIMRKIRRKGFSNIVVSAGISQYQMLHELSKSDIVA